MLAKIYSLAVLGMECETIEVEVDISRGLGSFTVVGLGDTAVQEARERVRSAIKNTNYTFPIARITVNLAPANIRKNGVFYDLPIAIGVLMSKKLFVPDNDLTDTIFVGELALDGKLRHINGILPMMIYAKEKGFKRIVIPKINAIEASLVDGVEIIAAEYLSEILDHFTGIKTIDPISVFDFKDYQVDYESNLDFAHIKGQAQAKRALEICAAGAHNICLNGAPGSGKTLMAKTLPTILPKLTLLEALEITKIYSIANKLPANKPLITQRPFRSVHHTASAISIIGGGRIPMPGEISLAHKGILFLDEILEHNQATLETLRQPLEDKKIMVNRINGTSEFPADFTLVAAMNPCPCGYYNVPNAKKPCTCNQMIIQRYQKRLSGPLMDRIDLYLDVSPVEFDKLKRTKDEESSAIIRARVQQARDRQSARFSHLKISANGEMSNQEIKLFCQVPPEAENLLQMAVVQMNLSARSYHRILKVARTIADLEASDDILFDHVAEALQYRRKENNE